MFGVVCLLVTLLLVLLVLYACLCWCCVGCFCCCLLYGVPCVGNDCLFRFGVDVVLAFHGFWCCVVCLCVIWLVDLRWLRL